MKDPGGPRVPRLARILVSLSAAREDRALLQADLEQRFHDVARDEGTSAAARWYWFQALRGVHAGLGPDLALMRRRSWEGTAGDIRQGVRVLARRPLYTAGVTGTLSIGLASAAAVLSVAWHVWLAPMPFPDPDRVVRLFELEPPEGGGGALAEPVRWRLSPPLLEDLRSHDWTTVSAVAGVSQNVFDWRREEGTSRISALVASPEIFGILGIAPLAGRALSFDEESPEVVLTEAFWRRAFGADPRVVGSESMVLSGVPYSIVGVARLPSGYPTEHEVILRMAFGSDQLVDGMRGARYLDVVARVDPAHAVAEASAEMNRVVTALGERFANHQGWRGEAVPLADELMRPYRGVLGLLLAAGGVFLLLAVVNVAGLVAARTVEGRQERSIRIALGASERRLLRATSIESLIVGAASGALALAGTHWLLGAVIALVPTDVPRVEDVRLSFGIAGAILVLAVVSGILVGLLGYLLSRGAGPAVGRNARAAESGLAGRRVLVASQVALTTLLATTGAGIVRNMAALRAVDMGFQAEDVASAQVMVSGERYPSPESRLGYWRDLLGRLQARGLDAAIGTNPPMAGVNMPWGYRIDAVSEQAFAQYHIVSIDYFRLMGIEVVEGRVFNSDDREGSEAVMVINETLAAGRFGGESPIGRAIDVVGKPKTIIGVVRATRHRGPGESAPEEFYVPFGQDPWPHAQVLVRGEPANVGAAVAEVFDELDDALGVPPVAPYTRFVAEWYAALRLQLIIVGVLAVVGTALASLGLYALVAYHVSARRREIGVRMALGASGARMFSEMVRRGVTLAGVGMILGFAAWYLSLPVTADWLGDVDVRDPWVPISVAALVGLVAVVASALPASRSVSVDPAVTLRAE